MGEGMADKAGMEPGMAASSGPAEGKTGRKTLPGRCLGAVETKADSLMEFFYAKVIRKMGQNLGLCILIFGAVLFLVRNPARSPCATPACPAAESTFGASPPALPPLLSQRH